MMLVWQDWEAYGVARTLISCGVPVRATDRVLWVHDMRPCWYLPYSEDPYYPVERVERAPWWRRLLAWLGLMKGRYDAPPGGMGFGTERVSMDYALRRGTWCYRAGYGPHTGTLVLHAYPAQPVCLEGRGDDDRA